MSILIGYAVLGVIVNVIAFIGAHFAPEYNWHDT